MAEARLFWLGLIDFWRGSLRGSRDAGSAIWVTAAVIGLAVATIWLSPVSYSRDLAQVVIYYLAILEIALGLRVGFLRIGNRPREYFLSVAARFWRRSFPYLIPAVILPVPVLAVITTHLTGSFSGWVVVFISLVLNALLFFFAASFGAILIRVITRHWLVRLSIAVLSVIVMLAVLSPGNFLFDAAFTFLSYGEYSQIFVIAGELSVVALLVLLQDWMLTKLPLGLRMVGRYWPVFLTGPTAGFGQGSSQFIRINKLFLRDSSLHRRLSAIMLGLVLFVSLLAGAAAWFETTIPTAVLLFSITTFSAANAQLISRAAADKLNQATSRNRHLPIDQDRQVVGSWLAGLFWQLGLTVIFWGIVTTWYPLGYGELLLLTGAAATQHLLVYGWANKLTESTHHLLAEMAVFGLAVLIGALPIILIEVASLAQVGFIQLIWLIFISILLQTTKASRGSVRYA